MASLDTAQVLPRDAGALGERLLCHVRSPASDAITEDAAMGRVLEVVVAGHST